MKRPGVYCWCAALSILSVWAGAGAADYPAKPIRWIVPWPPGGGVDIATRALTPPLAESLGQNIIVDNRPGASGMVGTTFAARAPADGYTLLMGAAGPNAILSNLNPNVPYHGLKDFASVALVANTVYVLVVNPSLPVKDVKELIALARAKPGQLTIGSAGSGTPAHLAGELLKAASGVDLVHVSYKGSAAPALEVMAGQITMTIETISPLLPHIRSGKLKALAVTSQKRSGQLPAVPTIAESGYPDYLVINWYGVLAPAQTPRPVIDKLNAHLRRLLERSDIRERLTGFGLEVLPSTPADFERFRKSDFANWARIVQRTHVRFEP
jgi:tripartite-type tricarboxylate transporter receptor subunit TctC